MSDQPAEGGLRSAQRSRSRVVLLGTGGGPSPKKLRSAPAALVMVDQASYVVDCGNGVGRQLVLAGVQPRDLHAVFITHHHSDHNADYGTLLLLAWASGLNTPVQIFGPPPLARMTELSLALNAYDIGIRIVDEGRPPIAPLLLPHDIQGDGLVFDDGRVKVTAALVHHPPVEPAFAFRFDTPDRSIVFSGDTTPVDSLVRLSQGADTLVHEALYVPGMERLLARIPNASRLREHLLASHTVLEDVGRVAARCGVKTLALTHFVPGDDPSITDEIWRAGAQQHFAGRVIVGGDLLEI